MMFLGGVKGYTSASRMCAALYARKQQSVAEAAVPWLAGLVMTAVPAE